MRELPANVDVERWLDEIDDAERRRDHGGGRR